MYLIEVTTTQKELDLAPRPLGDYLLRRYKAAGIPIDPVAKIPTRGCAWTKKEAWQETYCWYGEGPITIDAIAVEDTDKELLES